MALRVLVVDDEQKICTLIKAYLENAGFEVDCALSGDEGLAKFQKTLPDLVILDLMLPGIPGEDICQYIREFSEIPIVMLTAKSEEEQRITGLELGADDYITKPFSPRELVARVKAVLRRVKDATANLLFSKDERISIDVEKHLVTVDAAPLGLTPTEFRLLALFLRNKGKVFSRAELAERLFGIEYDSFEETIYVHVKNLRDKLEAQSGKKYIRTVYGVGYRWEEQDGH